MIPAITCWLGTSARRSMFVPHRIGVIATITPVLLLKTRLPVAPDARHCLFLYFYSPTLGVCGRFQPTACNSLEYWCYLLRGSAAWTSFPMRLKQVCFYVIRPLLHGISPGWLQKNGKPFPVTLPCQRGNPVAHRARYDQKSFGQ